LGLDRGTLGVFSGKVVQMNLGMGMQVNDREIEGESPPAMSGVCAYH
jgi:hypothetical protein